MTPLHMGALHPYEQALTVALAFGPFLVLGLVIWRRRRQEGAEETPRDIAGETTGRASAPEVQEAQRER